MKLSTPQKVVLLLLPILLLLSTAGVFVSLSKWAGAERGYIGGFIFYWLVWCFLVPLFILKRAGILSLFKEENPLFSKSNWLAAGLLVLIMVITVIMYPPTSLIDADAKLLMIAFPVAFINGIGEELLWRGLYIRAFPHNAMLSVIFPALGFAFWHISPQLIFPAEPGIWPFVASTFFLGLCYGWISYKTKSIKWNALSHSLGGILDLGGAIAPSIFVLLFQ